MSLAPGTRIGAYEIQSPLGAGGMGEVYRARDTKLGRHVAVKILPDDFVKDPARVARFQREAQALAALNHPHIAQIYGFEDSSQVHALVMELVEGPTLADRIAQGQIPLDEALPIARQIAEALEAAHEQGVIHRDLKPANIKVRPDGTVKVLDFGLAKLVDGPPEGGHYEPSSDRSVRLQPDLTASPTITSPAMMTGVGMLLGTAAYMAPEQARGKTVDKRADIWAFGCVMYEMLTGRQPFAADEVSDMLAMVLMKEPDWSHLPAATPPAVRTLLRRCLEKDRKRRLPDIGVARLEIDEALAAPALPATDSETLGHRGGLRLAWIVATVASLTAIGIAALHFMEQPPEPSTPIRFRVTEPTGSSWPSNVWSQALSPDGRYIAFLVERDGQIRVAIRIFDEEDARELPGTEGAALGAVFWSPDSRFLGFFADGKMKKIDIVGGPPQTLCDVPQGAPPGASWSIDGTILFGQSSGGLLRVSSGGGTPLPATTLDRSKNESSHGQPWFLPDGRRFLYGAISGTPGEPATVYVGSLDGTLPISVGESDSKVVYADGYLLFVRNGTLLAQAFDARQLETTGDPVVVAQDIPMNVISRTSGFSASAGVLSYRSTSFGDAVISELVWLNREGKVLGTVGERTDQTNVRLAPDGQRVAVSVLDSPRRSRDIWIHDLARKSLRTRFTFHAGEDWLLAWAPDGRSLAFSGGRERPVLDVYQRATDGSGAETLLFESADNVNRHVTSWSGDGRFLLYHTGAAVSQTGNDLWVLNIGDDPKPRALLQTPFNEVDGHFSPDSRWVAYVSNESGRNEVYVTPFPTLGGKWQISAAGGVQPRWRGDGKELFFLAGNEMMAAAVNGTSTAVEVGAVQRLFEVSRRVQSYSSVAVSSGAFGTGAVYDVAASGQRFLVNVVVDGETAVPPITVITNWTATLR